MLHIYLRDRFAESLMDIEILRTNYAY
jgi:hypothetical protein